MADISLESARLIKTEAKRLGFVACGIARAEALLAHRPYLEHYLEQSYYGDMSYMARHVDKRLDPRLLVPGTKSLIVLLHNYYPLEVIDLPDGFLIAKYAYGQDYHHVLKGKLFRLLDFIGQKVAPVTGRVFVDSAPVLERAWAVEAGLGWIGKHGSLIHPNHGSYCFIAELLVDIDLPADVPYRENHCVACTLCMDACPMQALVAPAVLDARRCISYLTIEHKGQLPSDKRAAFGQSLFGCDRCQDACPYNKQLAGHREPAFETLPLLKTMTISDWQQIDKASFKKHFKTSALSRMSYEKLKRNISFLMSS